MENMETRYELVLLEEKLGLNAKLIDDLELQIQTLTYQYEVLKKDREDMKTKIKNLKEVLKCQ